MAAWQPTSTIPPPIDIRTEPADRPEIHAFFVASEAYMSVLYPAENNHFTDIAALARPEATFLIARLHGTAVGCGAIMRAKDGSGEIKRMWVDPNVRRAQVGRRLLDALIAAARADGLDILRLETGISQPEAIALYRCAGFAECGPFGTYAPDPLSVFMALPLIRTT